IALKLKADLLEMHALLDGLTNIHNRRRFDESFASEWKRALRGSTPLSLIMLDIDYFKPYNDNYGHGAGDDCLRKVAATLAAAAERPGDLVARYGGEEFVVLLPETDEEGAARIAEHLRSQVEALQLPHGHSAAAAWLTVSAGVSCIVPQPDSQPDCQPATLLEQTDSMLYRCKQSGRNRVCRWSRRVSQDPEAEGSREGRPAPTFT
ncbi:MAG: diguanylate cyclase, partial [Rhodocyclaceae bacterium]|nr:diguanylate cyclase [Rhodocyclaceae bacterium]